MGDYVDCPTEKENDTTLIIPSTTLQNSGANTPLFATHAQGDMASNLDAAQERRKNHNSGKMSEVAQYPQKAVASPRTPKLSEIFVEASDDHKKTNNAYIHKDKLTPSDRIVHLSRLYRDLNSPLPNVRQKALEMIK